MYIHPVCHVEALLLCTRTCRDKMRALVGASSDDEIIDKRRYALGVSTGNLERGLFQNSWRGKNVTLASARSNKLHTPEIIQPTSQEKIPPTMANGLTCLPHRRPLHCQHHFRTRMKNTYQLQLEWIPFEVTMNWHRLKTIFQSVYYNNNVFLSYDMKIQWKFHQPVPIHYIV